jgi:hypothetical protein
MRRELILGLIVAAGTVLVAQEDRPLSPPGSASAQVLGRWVKPDRRVSTMTGEAYEGGKWIDITYSRPIKRGRDAFGEGSTYGKVTNAGAPVWRAGANVTTRLKTEVPLSIGGKPVPAGEYSLFIELAKPTEWTLIVSNWPAQPGPHYDAANKAALWGAFGYTPDKDVARAAMKVDALPFTVEELTWQFLNMTSDAGTIALMWDRSMGSVAFTVVR